MPLPPGSRQLCWVSPLSGEHDKEGRKDRPRTAHGQPVLWEREGCLPEMGSASPVPGLETRGKSKWPLPPRAQSFHGSALCCLQRTPLSEKLGHPRQCGHQQLLCFCSDCPQGGCLPSKAREMEFSAGLGHLSPETDMHTPRTSDVLGMAPSPHSSPGGPQARGPCTTYYTRRAWQTAPDKYLLNE